MDWATASSLDRVEEHRDDDIWIARQWAAPGTVVLTVDRAGRFPVVDAGTGPRLAFCSASGPLDPSRTHLLGISAGRAVFCTGVEEQQADSANVREVGHRLPADESDVAFAATALVNWHRLEPHCTACALERTPC